MSKIQCPRCHSTNVVKYGKDKGVQLYHCKVCRKKVRGNATTIQMKQLAKELTLTLHSEGLSSRKIQKKLRHDTGYTITHNTICRWIKEQT